MGTNGRRPYNHRPTLLTPQRQKTIIDTITAGNYQQTAALAAGISVATLYAWFARGEAERARLTDGHPPQPKETLYLNFLQAVEKARAQAEADTVKLVRASIPDNWQAGAWWLERSFPQRWGRRLRLEHTGDGGGPIPIDIQINVRDELTARITEMATRLAPPELNSGNGDGNYLDVEEA